VRSFIDTNVLVYADAADAAVKQARAVALIAQHLREGSGVISTQVLHEFVNAARRKLALPLDMVRARVRLYSRFETVNASSTAVLEALDLHALHQVSFWDALILQAARQSGCVQLLTEDLPAGSVIGGVRVVNPFAAATPAKMTRPRAVKPQIPKPPPIKRR
jgi:predicted nucleic acid-binding protein